jgi:pimeloyl-ACP methyl ester carboxylesterase
MQKASKKAVVRGTRALSIFVFLFATMGCNYIPIPATSYDPTGPIPEATQAPAPRAWTNQRVDDLVVMEQQSIYSPAPRDNGVAPAECDYIKFLRFRLRDSDASTDDKDAMLLMVPGFVEGANGFEYIGRQLVYIARVEYGLNLEVWGMDRRNNALEDQTGFQAAKAAANVNDAIQIMKEYYYGGAAVNGRTFKGFLTSKDTPYLSEFGLKMDTEDMFAIIRTMVPDPAVRKKKVFVGGHSMGGMHTSIFAGWDLDGDPATLDDTGYMNCAGMFALDSSVSPMTGLMDSLLEPYTKGMPQIVVDFEKSLTEVLYAGVLSALRSNLIPRFVTPALADSMMGTPLGPEVMALIQGLGMVAHMAPNEESTVLNQIPMSADMKKMLNQYQSRTMEQYNNGIPSINNFRYTNEALLGVIFDNNFSHIPMVRMGLGFLVGGPVAKKDKDVLDMLYGGDSTGRNALYAATDAGPDLTHLGEGPLYRWANFDEVANADHPNFTDTTGALTYTTNVGEMTDIQDLARALYAGTSDLVEWYFSLRRVVDLMALNMPYAKKYGINYMHADKITVLPAIVFTSGAHDMSAPVGVSIVDDADTTVVPGYSHMDPMFASANTPTHRKNDVIYPLIEFVQENINK